jgi:hypothetical protein
VEDATDAHEVCRLLPEGDEVSMASANPNATWGEPFPGEGWKEHAWKWHHWKDGQSTCGKYALRIAGRVRPGRELKPSPPSHEPLYRECVQKAVQS